MRGPYKAKPAPNTFADLIQRYRQSPRVLDWQPATRAKNDRILAEFLAANGRAMVSDLRRGDIIAMRDTMAATSAAANNWLKVIAGMLAYAVDIEMIPISPAASVRRLPTKNPDGFRQWREDEIEAFFAHWKLGSLPHRVVTLALYTGAARIDLVRLGWHSVQGDRIVYRRRKRQGRTTVDVNIPLLPPLAELLATLPPAMTFLETQAGAIRSEKGLTQHMRRWTVDAGLGDVNEAGHYLNLHGLRKALGRRLAEAGCSPHEVMAILGHENIASAQVYTKAYDRARAADSAAERLGMMSAPQKVTRLRNGK